MIHNSERPDPPGADLLRRVLLGLVTVLVVARPLVPGDDPARNFPWTGIANQVLTFGWLLTGFGWAVWRFASRRGEWKASWVEAGLLAAVVLVFISADQAKYQYGAWLAAAEWVALLAAFCLVRQLVRTPRENARLLAFQELARPDCLPAVKQQTNALERELAASGRFAEPRPLNLDPGLLTLGKFLLATTKDQGHRIYLREGIFAEVTLHFEAGAYVPWPWTYADYRQPLVLDFLGQAREYYRGLRKA